MTKNPRRSWQPGAAGVVRIAKSKRQAYVSEKSPLTADRPNQFLSLFPETAPEKPAKRCHPPRKGVKRLQGGERGALPPCHFGVSLQTGEFPCNRPFPYKAPRAAALQVMKWCSHELLCSWPAVS